MGLNELKKKYGIENGQKTTTVKDSGFSTVNVSGEWTSGSDTIDSLKQKYGITKQKRVTFDDSSNELAKQQARVDALRLANGQKLLGEVDMARLNTARRIQQRNAAKPLIEQARDIQKGIDNGTLQPQTIGNPVQREKDGRVGFGTNDFRYKDAEGNYAYNETLPDSKSYDPIFSPIAEAQTKEREAKRTQTLEDALNYAKEHPLMGEGLRTAGNVLSSVVTPLQSADTILTGREHDPYYQRLTDTYGTGVRQAAKGALNVKPYDENDKSTYVDLPVFGKTGRDQIVDFAVGTGESMVDTLLRGLAGTAIAGNYTDNVAKAKKLASVIGSSQASASAYSSGYTEALDRGADAKTAARNATAQAINEYIGEKYSLDSLLADKKIYSWGDALRNIAKQALTEGEEEGVTDILNAMADYVTMRDLSTWTTSVNEYMRMGFTEEQAKKATVSDILKQAAASALGGAISGVALGGGDSLYRGSIANRTGRTAQGTDAESIREILDAVDVSDEAFTGADGKVNKEAQKQSIEFTEFLDEAAKKVESGQELSTKEKARIEMEPVDIARSVAEIQAERESPESLNTDAIDNNESGAPAIDESKLASSLDKEGKNLVQGFIDEYKNAYNLTSKVAGARDVYTAARYGMSNVADMYKDGNKYGLTSDEVNRAVKAGMADRVAEMQKQNRIAAVDSGLTKESYKYSELTREQKNTLNSIGKRTHVRIELDASMKVNENAAWDRGTRTIRINPKTQNLTGSILHELTHYLQDTDTKSYTEYRDAVVNFLAGREGTDGESFLENKIREYTDLYEGHTKKNMSRNAIIDEIVSDGAMDFFNDDNMVSQYAQNKGFVQKIVDFFNDIIESVRTYLGDSQGNSISRELKSDLDEYVKIRDKWMAALEKSAGVSGDATSETTQGDSDQRLSIVHDITDVNGKIYEDVVNVDGKETKKIINSTRAFTRFIDRLAGRKIGVTDLNGKQETITLAKQGERVGKNGGEGHPVLGELKGIVGDIRKSTVVNISDALEVSFDSPVQNTQSQHGWLDEKGWNTKRCYVLNEGIIYPADLRIANARDGRHILYAVNVKKKDGVAAEKEGNKKVPIGTELPSAMDNKLSFAESQVDKNGVSYSLTTDSTGRQLSEGQKKYFKDSKVVDENGNLLRLYHGTPSGGFTVFRNWTYLSPSKEYAARYMNPGASSIRFGKQSTKPEVYEVYANAEKLFDTRKAKDRRIFMNEYFRHYGNGTPLMESGLPDWTDGEDLIEFFEDNDYRYDGIILDEGADGGYGDEVVKRGFSYLIKDSSQIKNTDNENPTDNSDIRYSITEDSEGKRLTEGQRKYFKDSKVVDEDGNLLVVYHGTDADFTVFDRTKGRANMDIQGMFFSPWEIDAGGYGNTKAYYLNITNPASESLGYKALNMFKGQNGAGVKAREYLERLGYDGVNNGGEEYIAFNSNQIKSVENENPTADEDIRYSLQKDGAEAVTKELAPENLYPETKFSLKMNDTIMNGALKANTSGKGMTYGHADEATLKAATDLSKKVADRLEGLKMFLPADNPGQVLKANGSYGRSAENSLICPRSLVSAYFMDIVSEKLGKPLSVNEQIIASQVLANITGMQKECTYCYVKNDRAKYREFFNEYYDSYMDTVAKVQKNRAGYAESIRMGKENNPLYDEFLKGRTATNPMWDRYTHFVNAALSGELNLSLKDLATASTRFDAKQNKKLAWLVKDAEDYCRSSAWPTSTTRKAKVDGKWAQVDYVSYNGSILKMKPELINALNNDFGLRLYSYSDYMPHNILENIQMVTDASVRGLKVLAYTKDTGFAKVFAPTGAGINVSVFGEMKNGQMVADEMMGANWEETKALRKKYKNVGAVFVATNDTAVEWALGQDWIDVVIPFHTVRTGTEFANYYGYSNYKAEQEDKKLSTWNEENLKSIPPTVHANDKATYLQALKDNNLSPRFSKWIDNPNYMKLVNETRMAYTDMQPVQANFNEADVMAEVDRIEKEGVYGLPQGLRDRETADDLVQEYADKAVDEIGNSRFSLNVDDYHNEGTAAYNEAKAEQDKSILRRMLDVRENDNDYISTAYTELQMANKAVGELLSNTHFMPAKKSIEYRAKKLIEQTNSARNRDEVIQKLSTLYEYIYNSDHVDGDMVSTVATDIADWLMSDEKPVYDEQEVKDYNGFKSLLKGRKFRLGDADWVNLDTARARHFFGTLSVGRNKGSYIDEVWSELCDEAKEFNVILDDSIANPVDMVNELMDKLEDNKPQPVRDGRDEADWKRDVYMTGQSILDEYFRTKFRSDQDAVNKLLAMYRTNINEYVNRKTKSLSDQYKARYTRYRERENSKAAKNSIIKNSKELARMLATPTNSKHIPEAFRVPVANFLKNIDFASEDFYTTGNVTNRTNDWLKLQQIVDGVINSGSSTLTGTDGQQYYISLDPSLSEKMTRLTGSLEKTARINDMSRTEIFELRDTIVSIKKCIENANTMIGDAQKRKVSDFGRGTISELSKLKDSKEFDSMLGGFKNLATNHMLDAQTRFHTFGEHAEEVLKEVRSGFDKKVQYVRDASDYVAELKEKLDVSDTEINAWRDKNFIKATIGSKKYTFRQDYVMSLYELMKRPQAREHILKGGITPTPFETEDNVAKKIVKRLYKPGNIKVTAADVNDLISQLSQKQKDFADGLTKYFLTAAEWGNKASMEAYGYRKFTDANYFPIKTNADFRDSNTKDIMGDGTQAIRNLGMTKAVVPHANNPLMLESIMDVFTNHIEQMSSYSGFLIPLDDVQKWYNYRPIDETGKDAYSKTVKTEIDRAYGKGANEYVKKFLKDINGTSQNERYIGKELISHFKGSAVGFNLSVAIQQPTAYVRAMAVMNPKYLSKALATKADTDMETIKRYSSIAQWKDWGFYDINVGKSMQSIIIGNTKAMDKVRDAQMWLAGKGDEVTWKQLWKAAELQVDDEQPGLTKRSDEYYKAVAEVFDNVIDRTQVVDSVFHRTDIMRSKNDLTQMVTSFMSEPMKSYNMMYRAAFDRINAKGTDKAKADKALAASASAFVLSAVFSAAAKSVITAMRKSGADRDKDWWERYKEAFTDEVLSNINPIEYVPLVKDIASIWDGYTVARSDMQWAQDLKYVWSRWQKTFNGEAQYTIANNILYSLKPLSDLTGIATYALQRDINAVIDTALEITDADKAEYLKYRTFGKKIGQKNASAYIRLAENAYIKGNTALGDQIVNDMVNAGVDESKLKSINKEREWISLGGTIEDYQIHKEALKSIRDENSGDDIKPAIVDYINAFNGTEEQKRTLWVMGGYGETTFDKTFNAEHVKEEASTEPQKEEILKTEKKSETSKTEKKTEAKRTLADEIEAKDVENKYSYVIESKDYSNQEKVEWLLSDSDKTSSKKYTGWKAVGGSDYDYIKHRSDLEKFSGDDKQEKVVRYIKNQTNDADRQKALWNMAGYKESTFGKFFN